MSEIENNPTIRTFFVDPPYFGPPQIFTTERETVEIVHPNGHWLGRCFGYNADEDEANGYISTTVIWNIIVREANDN